MDSGEGSDNRTDVTFFDRTRTSNGKKGAQTPQSVRMLGAAPHQSWVCAIVANVQPSTRTPRCWKSNVTTAGSVARHGGHGCPTIATPYSW